MNDNDLVKEPPAQGARVQGADRDGNALACPNCLSADHLGENVTGWRGIRSASMVDGRIVVRGHGRTEDAERASFFCSGPKCNEHAEIRDSQMVQLDRDGKPVVAQPEAQGELA